MTKISMLLLLLITAAVCYGGYLYYNTTVPVIELDELENEEIRG